MTEKKIQEVLDKLDGGVERLPTGEEVVAGLGEEWVAKQTWKYALYSLDPELDYWNMPRRHHP